MLIFNKYNTIVESIAGWYNYKDINPILYKIDSFHKSIGLVGDICEIGIYQGKFFLALCCMKQANEICLAIDSFGMNNETDWMYGNGANNKKMFENNYLQLFGDKQKYTLIQKQSSQICYDEMKTHLHNKVRFFSIDGDHTLNGAYYDLELSRSLISDYGVIIVDDYTNPAWPEVKQAVDKFLETYNDMHILTIHSNKLFLCNKLNATILDGVIKSHV